MDDGVTTNEFNNHVKAVEAGFRELRADISALKLWRVRITLQLEDMWKAFRAPSRAARIFGSRWAYVLVPTIIAGTLAWGTAVYTKADSVARSSTEITHNQCVQIKQLRDQRLSDLAQTYNITQNDPTKTRADRAKASDFYLEQVRRLPRVDCH